jgi:hypothetical protein
LIEFVPNFSRTTAFVKARSVFGRIFSPQIYTTRCCDRRCVIFALVRIASSHDTLIDLKTSAVPLAPVADERPVADLPEMTDCTTREPLLADNTSSHPATVLLPPASFPGRGSPLAESGAVGSPQSSVLDAVSLPTVRLPKLPGPQQSSVVDSVSLPTVRLPPRLVELPRASAAELPVTVRLFSSVANHDRPLSPYRHRNGKEKTWSPAMYRRRAPLPWNPMPPSMRYLMLKSAAL